jgi:hypothetical protein
MHGFHVQALKGVVLIALQAMSNCEVSPETQIAELLAVGTSLSVAAANLSVTAASFTTVAMNQLYGGAGVPCPPGIQLSACTVRTASPSTPSGEPAPSDEVVLSRHALGNAGVMPKDSSCTAGGVVDNHRPTVQVPSPRPEKANADGDKGSPESLWDTFGTVVRSKVGLDI